MFTGVSMPNEATLLDAGTSQILQPQTFVWNENGTAITGAEDDVMGQVTTLTLVVFTGLDGHLILIVSFFLSVISSSLPAAAFALVWPRIWSAHKLHVFDSFLQIYLHTVRLAYDGAYHQCKRNRHCHCAIGRG